MRKLLIAVSILALVLSCKKVKKEVQTTKQLPVENKNEEKKEVPFVWKSANIYFLLTDRFNNGNPENDINFERKDSTAVLRGFEGGDMQGITKKIEEGYFIRDP